MQRIHTKVVIGVVVIIIINAMRSISMHFLADIESDSVMKLVVDIIIQFAVVSILFKRMADKSISGTFKILSKQNINPFLINSLFILILIENLKQ